MVAVGVKKALLLEGPVYEHQMQYLLLTCAWLVTYPALLLLAMFVIRDTSIESEASSALHLESRSCGNAQGSIKSLENVH